MKTFKNSNRAPMPQYMIQSAASIKNAVSAFQISCKQTTFFYLGRFLNKLADDHCSSITKGSIYYIKHMYIQPFTTIVDCPEM